MLFLICHPKLFQNKKHSIKFIEKPTYNIIYICIMVYTTVWYKFKQLLISLKKSKTKKNERLKLPLMWVETIVINYTTEKELKKYHK